MSLFWLVIIVFGMLQVSWIFDLWKKKLPRSIILKDWFNSTVWSLGWISCLVVLLIVTVSLSTIQSFGNWSGLYSNADWYTIVSIVGINSVGPYFTVALLFLFIAALLWVCKTNYKGLALWKYSPEDIVIKDRYKEDKKEEFKKKYPVWFTKIVYPEKKKRSFKHPKLAKFFLLDLEDK